MYVRMFYVCMYRERRLRRLPFPFPLSILPPPPSPSPSLPLFAPVTKGEVPCVEYFYICMYCSQAFIEPRQASLVQSANGTTIADQQRK